MQYRTLGRTGVQVSTLVLAPGLDLAPDEKIDTPPSLLDASLRRRR